MQTINILAVHKIGLPGHILTQHLKDYIIEGACSSHNYSNYLFNCCTFAGTASIETAYINCKFSDCAFDNASFFKCTFIDCEFTQCEFASVNNKVSCFRRCCFNDCLVVDGAIDHVDGELSTIWHCVFERLSVRSTNLDRCKINNTKFNQVDFSSSRATCTNFDGTAFRSPLGDTYLATSDITNAALLPCDRPRRGIILTEPIVGYKKTYEDLILKALIPVGSIVFSINGGKCRTNRAIILDTCGRPMLHSQYDHGFRYSQGQEVIIPDFDLDYRNDCSTGFHFFKSRKEAEEY